MTGVQTCALPICGGGNADDLSAFNDEQLVRAIAAGRIPTLVGVGHEVDVTLADMAADVRAATPSNAAQIIVPDRREYAAAVRRQMAQAITRFDANIDAAAHEIRQLMSSGLEAFDRQIDEALWQAQRNRQVLAAYDPQAVLARGYAIVRGEVDIGSEITIQQHKQTITAEVKHVAKN